jgi:ABC-type Fe3+ transport system permease subunit
MVLLTALSLVLGVTQGWAAARTYQPGRCAGFHTGVLHGMLMPAALPGLLLGRSLPIYAANNTGRSYNIGYIFGINACGTLFFGIAFWQRQGKRQDKRT